MGGFNKKSEQPPKIAWIMWIFWIVLFVVFELIALFTRQEGDTLSEVVWYLLQHPTFYFFFTAFLIWLLIHFYTRGKV